MTHQTTTRENTMSNLIRRIGDLSARRPWTTIGAWAVLAALVVVLSGALGGSFTDDFSAPGSESAEAIELLEERLPEAAGGTAVAVFAAPEGEEVADFRPAVVEELQREGRDPGRVLGVVVEQPHDVEPARLQGRESHHPCTRGLLLRRTLPAPILAAPCRPVLWFRSARKTLSPSGRAYARHDSLRSTPNLSKIGKEAREMEPLPKSHINHRSRPFLIHPNTTRDL